MTPPLPAEDADAQAAVFIDETVLAGRDSRDFPARPFLSTRRMRLRELCLADIPALQALNSDQRVTAHLVEPCEATYMGVAKLVFQANVNYIERPGLGVWRASDHAGRFLGVFSLMPIEGTDEVEIGTRLHPSTWGRLYPVEGGRALCEHAFVALRLPYLVGLCDPCNDAVPVILRRLGFEPDGQTLHFGNRALRYVLPRDAWLAKSHRRPSPIVACAPVDGRR